MVVPSKTRSNIYGWLGQMPMMREWIGERRLVDIEAFGFEIENKDFEMTISVKRNDIQDDNAGVYSPMFSELGNTAALHPDNLIFGLLPKGFTTACYDNQNYFDDSHGSFDVNGAPTAVSNIQDGVGPTWYLLDTTRVVRPLIYQERMPYRMVALDKPDDWNVFNRKEYIYGVEGRSNAGFGLWQLAFASKATLNIANFTAARDIMRALRGDQGRLLGIDPNIVVVPPVLEDAADTLFNKPNMTGGESNIYNGKLKVMMTPWLA